MKLLSWMKGKSGSQGSVDRHYLTHSERWALRRMIGHFDDGFIGYGQRGEWERKFNEMAERLTLRFRDPFGDKPIAITSKEAEALAHFQKIYEREAVHIYPGNMQMSADAWSIRDAVEREGRPEELPAWEMQSEHADKKARKEPPSWSGSGLCRA